MDNPGRLHYRNYRNNVKWRHDSAQMAACSVTALGPEQTLFADTSFDGNGGVLDWATFSCGWLPKELNQLNHNTNALKLQSMYIGLRAFLSTLRNKC